MNIKILCGCETKYSFSVDPVQGRMPGAVQCPSCQADGTEAANIAIAEQLGQSTASLAPEVSSAPTPPPTASSGLRIAQAAEHGEVTSMPTGEARGGSEPQDLLSRNTYFIKERVGMLKMVDTYDILDPQTSLSIGIAKEEPPVWAKWLRLLINKSLMPTAVNIYELEGGAAVLTIRRGFTFLRSKVEVVTGNGQALGYFKSKLFSLGGGFFVFDSSDCQVAEVKGNWKGKEFKFLGQGGREIGTVTKKWAGLRQELFTSADNYVISLNETTGSNQAGSALLLAAGLAIDIVFKESK